MTIKEVNEIFRTKYPEGEIVQKGKMGGASKSSVSVFLIKIQKYILTMLRIMQKMQNIIKAKLSNTKSN